MKYQIIAVILALAASFYVGTQTNKPTDTTTDTNKTVDKNIQTQTVTIKKPDGTTKTVTKTNTTVKAQTTSKTEVVTAKSDKVTVQLLYGTSLTRVEQDRETWYGVSINKTLVGPVTGGLFLIMNGRSLPIGGVSIGVEL